jgi:hypothetical protein
MCLFVAIKGLSAQSIHTQLLTVLGQNAIAYSTLTKYRRQRKFPSVLCHPSEEHPSSVIDNAILDALEKPPFPYVHQLAKFTCIPTTTVHQHLTRSLGFVVKRLR